MKYNTTKDVIEEAARRGSTATTYKGAYRWLTKNLPAPIDIKGTDYRQTYYRHIRRGSAYSSRAEWQIREHNRRLCARYVGMSRLPKHLSTTDRATIAAHPANREYVYLQTLPIYARAYYIKHVEGIARFSRFVAEARRETGELRDWAEIAWDAYTRYDWGRLQVRTAGDCVAPENVGMVQTGSNWDWNKRSTLQRRTDYSLIAPREHGNIYTMHYVDASRGVHLVRVSANFYRVDLEEIKRHTSQKPRKIVLNIHTQRRILAPHVPAVITVDYDRETNRLMLVDSHGERYHLNYVSDSGNAQRQVREAVTAFRKRRAEKIAITNPEQVWVQVEDSYNSGNCRSMTDSFAAEYLAKIGASGPVCTRADLLLSVRDDSYTRRAVSHAAARMAV